MDLHCTVVNPALNLSIMYKCKKLHYIEYLPKTLIILVSRGVKIYIIHLVHWAYNTILLLPLLGI